MSRQKHFYCRNCDHFFTAQGQKIERQDPIFGACWDWQAECPRCKQLAKEHKKVLKSSGSSRENLADTEVSSSQACSTGTCPFAN